MKVLVIDDHPIVLEGCCQLLRHAGVKDVLKAHTLVEGFSIYRTDRPDVIIVDLAVRNGALGGLSFIRRLRARDTRTSILVFSVHDDPFIVSRALKAGANGYILKDTPSHEVLNAFERIRGGLPYLSHELASEVAFMEANGRRGAIEDLSHRELQILSRLAEGKSYTVIADEMAVSYKTVANSCSQLKGKLGVRSLPELVRLAIETLPFAGAKVS